MSDIVAIGGLLLLFLVVVYVARSYSSLRVKAIKTPFVEFDVNRFMDLSKVRMFMTLSAAMPIREVDAETMPPKLGRIAEDVHDGVIVAAAWNMVADAFIKRFAVMPSLANIEAQAATLGHLNVEFIKMYLEIYHQSFGNGQQIPRKLALEYILRAPALCQRIDLEPGADWHRRFEEMDAALSIRQLSLSEKIY